MMTVTSLVECRGGAFESSGRDFRPKLRIIEAPERIEIPSWQLSFSMCLKIIEDLLRNLRQ